MNKPQYFTNVNDRFDCDPADCSDRNEISIESAEEFTRAPEEFGSEHAAEFGAREGMPEYVNMPEPEQDFFNSPGLIAPLGMTATEATQDERRTDLSSLYGTEAAEDCSCGCGRDGCDGDDGCGCSDNAAETANEFVDPNDETAAAYDDEADFYEPTESYETEAAEDCGCGHCDEHHSSGDGCDGDSCRFDDNSAETAREYGVDLADDETAACDDRTFSAQERCSLDDYEIISDVLGGEKQLVKLYSTALCESSEEPLRNLIKENLMECANDQYATFEYMEKRGLYPTDEAPEEQIVEAKRVFGPLCK